MNKMSSIVEDEASVVEYDKEDMTRYSQAFGIANKKRKRKGKYSTKKKANATIHYDVDAQRGDVD